jgi:8-oxo-dGTP pyrophosphatase MutT (NUDIX family)
MPIRDAATVMLVRDGAHALEVCLLRRHAAAVFVPGAHVFPGGAVDESDRVVGDLPGPATRTDDDASRLLGLTRGGLAYWLAAVRECFEEAGVVLATTLDGAPVDLTDPATAARFAEHRAALRADERSLADVCRLEGLALTLDAMHYVSHWVTPPGAPRRYDTRFFAASLPAGQVVVPDECEVVDECWLPPAEALRRFETGDLDLILPTARCLEMADRFATATHLLDALARAEAEAVHPDAVAVVDDGGGWRVRLHYDTTAEAVHR